MRSKRVISAAAFSLALAGGAVAGALLGTPALTAAQEDGTTTTEDDSAATEDTEREGRCHGGFFGHRIAIDVAAEALGVEEDELRDSLRDGNSIADVAAEQGVDVQTVIDALVAAATERIDEAVADGDLDAERAEALKADLPERITDAVNGELPGPGQFRRGRGHH